MKRLILDILSTYHMKKKLLLFALSALSFNVLSATITDPAFIKSTYTVYEKAEATFTLTGTKYANPYNPDQVIVDAIISLPGGGTDTVPCFYFIPTTLSGGNAT